MPRDLRTPRPRRLRIPGPIGELDGTLEEPAGSPRAAVLHLHPHPLHGGTRQNNVVRHGALGSLQAGCVAYRIDFRGVGRSEGSHDHGVGEIEDAEAAFDHLGERYPGIPRFLWGFSFGSRVGLELSIRRRADLAGYMAVAWPTNFYDWPDSLDWPERTAFLAGTEDEFIDFDRLDLVHRQGGRLQLVQGAGHFFPGELSAVRSYTADVLEDWIHE